MVSRHVVVELDGCGWVLPKPFKEVKLGVKSTLEPAVNAVRRVGVSGILKLLRKSEDALGDARSPV